MNYYNIEIAENTSNPDILKKILERDKDDGVSWYAVKNINCPSDILRMVLERGKNDNVSQNAAKNPNCPPDALRTVLERGKDNGVSQWAARNPNCPPDALKMVLERGKNDIVSYFASKNPNCPQDVFIKWMQDTGKIGKEDPALHIIEYTDKEDKIDEDLEKLKKMVNY